MASATDTPKADNAPPLLSAADDDRNARPLRVAQDLDMPLPRSGDSTNASFFEETRRFLTSPMRSLSRRIVAINLAGLIILVTTVLYLNQLRDELINVRVESLETQAQIIATAIAEIATAGPDETRIETRAANNVLRQLTLQTGQRAQLYISGRLLGDTRSFGAAQSDVETRRLPPLFGASGLLGWIEELYSKAARYLQKRNLPLYIETPSAGISTDEEIYKAQRGKNASALRANSGGELIVSVAVPLRRLKVVMGVLVLSTEGGDIDRVIRAGRIEILRVFILAGLVSILLAFVLANGIARPLRRLANAAEAARLNEAQMMVGQRVEIPDLTSRSDEIGHLSGAMRRMTNALYARIDAIESFAADVAHEIKNPLSSLRSAVETLDYAKTPESRDRLFQVIREDVDRLDRLVTDISNASRLDAELVREEREPFDIGRLIETTVDILSVNAADRDVKLIADTPADPVVIQGLESRIAQVLSNLIANGISFSPEGGTLRVAARRDEMGTAIITVEDQGPGVPLDNLENIFERFYTERPESEAFGRHSGLGLSISKQIVEAHGGSIYAENIGEGDADTSPHGARFVVRLPIL